MEKWKYYNSAMIPAVAPHENVEYDRSVLKSNKKALLARYTSNFDYGYESDWWYVIKDTPFDINTLKSKRRYEINKGKKNFYIEEIKPDEHAEELYNVTVLAYSQWPKKYRPNIQKDDFFRSVKEWDWYKVLGVFELDRRRLCGYALLSKIDRCVEFNVLRVIPEFEKLGINAAAVNAILVMHENFIKNGGYICDGTRSISHETLFQDYLEKYFGFRKAYCKLHIQYSPKIKWLIKALYPFRKILFKLDGITKIHQINGILKMENIVRAQKKKTNNRVASEK